MPLVTSLADYRNLATCALFGFGILVAYRCVVDFEVSINLSLKQILNLYFSVFDFIGNLFVIFYGFETRDLIVT